METNRYTTAGDRRVGVLIASTRIATPGIYTFSCDYPAGEAGSEIVLALGPELGWEYLSTAARAVVSGLAGWRHCWARTPSASWS